MSLQILATVRGEIIFTSRENIEIKEYHVDGKQILTDNPHLLINNDLSKTFNLIKWFREWNHQLQCEHECSSLQYIIRMVTLSTLNDVYDDIVIHEKYNDHKFVELIGESNLSLDGRFKIGRRILYNWFVTSLRRLQGDDTSDHYMYMEIVAKPRMEDT